MVAILNKLRESCCYGENWEEKEREKIDSWQELKTIETLVKLGNHAQKINIIKYKKLSDINTKSIKKSYTSIKSPIVYYKSKCLHTNLKHHQCSWREQNTNTADKTVGNKIRHLILQKGVWLEYNIGWKKYKWYFHVAKGYRTQLVNVYRK